MNTLDYNNDNTEEVMENYSEATNVNYPTYPMYYCPLCNYSMSMRSDWDDSDEYDDDLDEYDDDPEYRQRPRRRRRPRRRPRRRYPYYYPRPYTFPYIFPYLYLYDDDWDWD